MLKQGLALERQLEQGLVQERQLGQVELVGLEQQLVREQLLEVMGELE